MANPLGEGSPNNPKVTSKFDRMHGQPRKPGSVSHPGGTAHPGEGGGDPMSGNPEHPLGHERHAPTDSKMLEHGKVHHYAHDHPAMGGLHHGARAKHPYHDHTQGRYEQEHHYHGRGPMDAKK